MSRWEWCLPLVAGWLLWQLADALQHLLEPSPLDVLLLAL